MSKPVDTSPRHTGRKRAAHSAAERQRGVTLLFGLIALAIMMIGAAAMVRSMNTSMLMSGNLGFKRDLTNQAERATAAVWATMNTGALKTETARESSSTALNYSAKILPGNAQRIPDELIQDTLFAGVGSVANDISVPGQGVTIRYLIDRMCNGDGAADDSKCTMSEPGAPVGVDDARARAEDAGTLQRQTVYRLSIRVTGPRNTQAYYQTTFTL